MSWAGVVLVAPLWGVGSTQLFLQAWLATADVVIAILALARGRATPARATGMAVGALISGSVCSVLLEAGFWFLLEVQSFGRTWIEWVVYCTFVGLSAGFMLPRLPQTVRKSWQTAMNPSPDSEGDASPTAGT